MRPIVPDAPQASASLVSDADATPRVRALFDEIAGAEGGVCNFWRAIAHDPELLATTWSDIKRTMFEPREGGLDLRTKELVYLAISVANGSIYCVHCHAEAARQCGMSEREYADLLAVVAVASHTNRLATALRVPVDDSFPPLPDI